MFLPLPPNERLPLPPPDSASQQRQLEDTRSYVLGTIPRLPNLLATRTTYGFDDSDQVLRKGGWAERDGLHLVGMSKGEVSIFNERQNRPIAESSSSPAPSGLVTWGEFGSLLLLIIDDSAKGTMTWSHWEQGAAGPVSVFDYSVPKAVSHYQVATPLQPIHSNGGSSRWFAAGGLGDVVAGPRMLRSKTGYHGSLWIDPATGTILRASVIADLRGNPTLQSGAVAVDYGPVHIGNQTFFCPQRSLALSTVPGGVSATMNGTATEWLNESLFTGYHLFAATAHILTGQVPSSPQPAPAAPAEANAVTPAVPPPSSQSPAETSPGIQLSLATPVASEAAQISPQETAIPAETVPATPNPSAGTSAGHPTPSPLVAAAPPPPPNSPPPAGHTPTFHLNVNAVLIPVVVRDHHGRYVNDLQEQDFKVLDDGHPRPLSGFLLEKHELPPSPPPSPVSPLPNTAAAPPLSLPSRITVFLFDDLDMDYADVARAQPAVIQDLDLALTGSDMAAVVSASGKINSGLTRDRSKLAAAIQSMRPVDLYHADTADCPKINAYQANLIVNMHDPNALQDVIRQIIWVCDPRLPIDMARGMAEAAARHTYNVDQQTVRATYAAISEYVRRMASLPGQHTMVLVSSGFLPLSQESRYEESRLMNLAANASVTINAVDARGLYTTALTASQDLQNREPRQVADYHESEKRTAENGMSDLANATGGLFFHNNNDLTAGVQGILQTPETVYVLELSMKGVKSNGAWHALKVTVDRPDVQVQARKGYVAPKGGSAKAQ